MGWDLICARARQAAAGIVLRHGVATIPASVRPGLPVQVQLAEDDPFTPQQATAQWQADADRAGLAAQVFTYPGAGHFYTDPSLGDYHPASADRTWQHVTAFLSAL